MTESLVGNLAAFNSVLQLSLPNAQSSSMIKTDVARIDSHNIMKTLVSGSVAENLSSEFPRLSTVKSPNSYDPFMPRPFGRYSPPKVDMIGNPVLECYGSDRVLPYYDTKSARSIASNNSQAFPGIDATQFSPSNDVAPKAITIERENSRRRPSQDSLGHCTGSPMSQSYADYDVERHQQSNNASQGTPRYHSRRRPFNHDEFDGPAQYLPLPLPHQDSIRAQDMLELPVHLELSEQDEVMRRANDILSECAFHFIAKYQFPIPLERDKPRVQSASDREWTEWAYLLKRLATKRRIPARVLFENQIKQLVTILDNSIAARQSTNKDQLSPKRKPKDDRYILQLASAGTQVAKILMDSLAMEQLNELYVRTEAVITERRCRTQAMPHKNSFKG